MKAEVNMREWYPDRHFLITILTFIRKILYLKSFEAYEPDSGSAIVNKEAAEL